ncbi:hypothetical protein GA0115260_102819 [Streptomyces sp. MnatMP-M27]|nr:hypothetical protein GA0115260_102819 [Streptomyces sp. MnatMP-M27]
MMWQFARRRCTPLPQPFAGDRNRAPQASRQNPRAACSARAATAAHPAARPAPASTPPTPTTSSAPADPAASPRHRPRPPPRLRHPHRPLLRPRPQSRSYARTAPPPTPRPSAEFCPTRCRSATGGSATCATRCRPRSARTPTAGPPSTRPAPAEQTTRERWNKIHGLLSKGVGLLDCSRRLGLALNTVKRYARMPEPTALRIAPSYRPTLVDLKGVNIPIRLLSWVFAVDGEAAVVTWCGTR